MRRRFADIRPHERRAVLGGVLTLFAIMSGHSLLETARDALFLARVEASRLPWVYLAIAALAFGITLIQERLGTGSERRTVAGLLVVAGGITAGFWWLVAETSTWTLYALYVWSGVIATLVVVRFWLLMSELFTVTQAKRLFALIGVGSVVGAISGTGLAWIVAQIVNARALVLVSAAMLMAAGVLPIVLLREPDAEGERSRVRRPYSLRSCVHEVVARPYASRVALLVLVSSIAVTLADYLFKAIAADQISADRLGTFFASVYFGLNVLSLVVQVGLVGWLVRRLSISVALAILPILLLGGALTFAVTGGLLAALLIKGVDGTLRYSLHRTATELLFVPLSERVRRLARGLIDVVCQRGGQAVASLAILGLLGLGGSLRLLAVVLAGLALLWTALAGHLRRHYVNVFRTTLNEAFVQTRIDFPDLDMDSLESLIAALNSDTDGEVLAAMDLLAAQDKTRLIPAMILYHPSREVVVRALELFAEAGRADFLRVARRLGDEVDPAVRAAVLRALAAVEPGDAALREALRSPCPAVRATAVASLVALGDLDDVTAGPILDAIFAEGDVDALVTLAQTIRFQRRANLGDVLLRLAEVPDPRVRSAAAEAMAEHPDRAFFRPLLDMLASTRLRRAARKALLAMGDEGLSALEHAFDDRRLPPQVRKHLPRTVSRFAPGPAAHILLRRLPRESDGMVRFKIIRGLEQIRLENPGIELDRQALERATQETLAQAYRMLDWRLTLERGTAGSNPSDSPVGRMLVELLADKAKHALDRLFRLLALQYPAEDILNARRGLYSRDRKTRASSRELLENILQPRLRDAVLGLVEEVPDEQRLEAASPYYEPRRADYMTVLRNLLASPSESLRSLTVYHIGELGLGELAPALRTVSLDRTSYLSEILERVVTFLRSTQPAPEPG